MNTSLQISESDVSIPVALGEACRAMMHLHLFFKDMVDDVSVITWRNRDSYVGSCYNAANE